MKKIFATFILCFGLFVFFPKPIFAECYPVPLVVGCSGAVSCGDVALGFCCSTMTECEGQGQFIEENALEPGEVPEGATRYSPFRSTLFFLEREIPGFNFVDMNLGAIMTNLLTYIFAFAGIGLLVYLVVGGFKLMTAAGDPKKMQEGQHIITNAVIGFVVVFVAFWIVQLVANILGLESILNIF